MANIWKANRDVNNHPNRNNFDLSFQNHLTLKFGNLYPVFCQRVVPGDSFRINTAFGLKFMPMVFPVQSRMRAHMHYFYVRNKNLWENWQNWISGLVSNDEHPHPYVVVDDKDVKTGSIHDFLNVPTTVVTHDSVFLSFEPIQEHGGAVRSFLGSTWPATDGSVLRPIDTPTSSSYYFIPLVSSQSVRIIGNSFIVSSQLVKDVSIAFSLSGNVEFDLIFADAQSLEDSSLIKRISSYYSLVRTSDFNVDLRFDIDDTFKEFVNSRISEGLSGQFVPFLCFKSTSTQQATISGNAVLEFVGSAGFYEYSSLGFDLFSNDRGIRLNALPYRAYESIYRAYYANSVLQPLRDGQGKPRYNDFNTTVEDGADTTDYHLFQRNYELDAYTSCLPSPQQGPAPLVGVSALGEITVEDENGITTARAEFDDDGNSTRLSLTSPAASVDHARVLMNMSAGGFNINDFRAGNALTRLLETSLRKGYRYLDFIAGHYGKAPQYRELDMPEFIGGFSRDVNVTTTFASADTYDPSSDTGAELGDYVGNASVFGGSNHSVSHYCDDFGYIIGILCVVPSPAYSQVLPKQMVCPQNYLDYFFPEMNQLGLQPITYEEMTPIQRYIESLVDPSKSLHDTFGYQRIYHDYVANIDQLHGEFRGSMKDFLVNRIFAESPQLGDDFLRIQPSEVNDIFVNTTESDDTIIGQIIFDVKAKRPINRIVIPGLGR